MATITQIREKFSCLPEKDIKIANKLLNKRDFLNLEELVNSDVEKMANKYFACNMQEDPSKECLAIEEQYNALKDLQSVVSEQASAFKEDLPNEDEEYIEDETLDYYA